MAVVVFNEAGFKARYPAFAAVSDSQLAGCFADAGLYLNNTDTSVVQDITTRERLLWMLTAHCAFLEGALSADGQAGPVGRISAASEGSVSVTYTGPAPGSGDWFNQTAWGASFWQATINFRSAMYVPQPTNPYATNGPRDWFPYPNGRGY